MYKLRKRFTTRDGIVHTPDPRPWGITQEVINEFGPIMPPDKGCATCIFVRLEGGIATDVFFETTGQHHETHPIDALKWAHSNMYNPGSGYNADTGRGPWSVQAVGVPSEIVDNIGLPNGEHVSTWIVMTWFEDSQTDPGEGSSGPEPVEPPPGYVPHIQIAIDSKIVYEYGQP